MSAYSSQYPDVPIDPAIQRFFETFYKLSDTPDAHQAYAELFTEHGTLIIGSKVSKGQPEILAFRQVMWEHVASRSHKPLKVFPFGQHADEMMLYGTVGFGMKNGKSNELDWAARAHLVKEGGEMKLDYYQVYLDTAAQAASR
ncbi:hypothetical protein MMC24_004252 [Lignoscripta atroalba]|nr:hypothetical protein [Lignoscripta atroalba]